LLDFVRFVIVRYIFARNAISVWVRAPRKVSSLTQPLSL
jgi:hypothetical protein